MKQDIAQYVAECDVCRRIKAEHQKPAGTLQPLAIPEWKWDKVEMDFITGFPRSQKGHDAIFVVIDRFSKVAHFLPVKETITASQLADLYVSRIVSLHGVPLEINLDRGSLFTSRFWESFQQAMGTHLSFSTAYHPQSSGQVERVNQILEDMLRACVISFGKKWEESLPYAEFSYNNSYQASLKMAPFEVLYGRKCRTPLNWSETGERPLFGPDIIQHAEEQVHIVREHLKTAQSRQKSNYDRHHKEMVYQPGEQAYLRVTPMKGTHRFGIKGKLAPRYIGPFRILQDVDLWHISWNCRRTFLRFTMFSMCRNSVAASRNQAEQWIMKCLIARRPLFIENIRSASLIKLNVELVRRQPSSLKFSGQIILKMKPLGNAKIIFVKNTPLCSFLPLNSRDENFF